MNAAAPVPLARVRSQLDVIRRQLSEQSAELAVLQSSLDGIAGVAADELARSVAERSRTVEGERDAELSRLAANAELVRQAAQHQIDLAVAHLAPGVLSASWTAANWEGVTAAPVACHLRVGSLNLQGVQAAAILPLLGTAGWVVDGSEDAFADLVRSVLVRLTAHLGPYGINTVVYDESLALGAGAFSGLRAVVADAFRPTVVTPDALHSELDRLLAGLAAIGDDLAAQGFASLLDASAVQSRPAYPFRLLVINADPGALPEASRTRLRQIVRAGAPLGLTTVLRGRRGDDLTAGLMPLTLAGQESRADALGELRWTPDRPPSRELIELVVDTAARQEPPAVESLPFDDLLAGLEQRWLDPGNQGLRAVIGRSGRSPLAVDLRSENPPMPNALIGGAVGQGKSNLLLVMIHALAAQYAPTDLEMLLLDFRDGVEFAPLGPDANGIWLPHATVLGLECDREFGLAVLEDMARELAERTGAFKHAGVAKINDYRRATGQPMPRRLLIIDEFQRLLDGDDPLTERAAQLLDDLSRTGRAAGFHLVLASQTVSGIRGLATRADAIFGQFHHRVSLRNTPAESAAILAPRNTAAADLVNRGEVVVNAQFGDPEANRMGVVAHADQTELARLRRELWLSAPPITPPVVFRRACFLPWTDEITAGRPDHGLALVPGAPISVRERVLRVTLAAGGQQAVAVVGSDDELVAHVLASLVAAAIQGRPVQVHLLDAVSVATEHPIVRRIAGVAGIAGFAGGEPIVHRGEGQIAAALADLAAAPSGAASTSDAAVRLVVALGLDAVRVMDQANPETFRTPGEDLRSIAQHGSDRGTYLIGWWRSRHACEQQLGFGEPGVRCWALCGVGREDVQAVCGPLVQPPSGDPRILWYDRTASAPTVLVPFDFPVGPAERSAEVTR